MAAHLVDVVEPDSSDDVLDVACGTGNVAITARRRGANVTGIDITPAMLEDANENADIAGTGDIEWREGNAIDLPFAADDFDIALSCVGHMFADPPEAAARELLRVTRPGGAIAFTSWTPTGVVPAMASVLRGFLPAIEDAPEPPFLWGDPDVVHRRLGDGVSGIEFETGHVAVPVQSPAHFWRSARTQSGMFIVALDEIRDDDRPTLRVEMIDTIDRYFDGRRNVVPLEYRLSKATVA